MTHELRAPLHAIVGLAELLADGKLAPRERDLALSIQRQGEAMQVVIDDILELSRISAGELELVIDAVGPRILVDEVLTTFEPAARAKGLDLTVLIADEVPRVIRADRHRLRQVLVNLVSNAVKYTSAGSITIEVKPAPTHQNVLRVFVHDTGPGIPASAQPDLFDAFTQARSRDQIKGTGLGLSITRRLIELMNGWIYVCSSTEGSTFCAELPFAPARRAADKLSALADPPTHTSRRVLVVDDTDVNLMVAQSQLERLGHEAHAESSGADALMRLDADHFDLVLLDWHMPGIDGLEVLSTYHQRCAQLGHTPTPVVVMTASVSSASRRTCLEAGAADFLPKPVSLNDLARCLGRWFDETEEVAASADPVASSSAIDDVVLNKMAADLGGFDPVRMVIETFVADVGSRREQLASSDTDVARRAAHTLKSTSALLGAHQLADALAHAEAALSDQPSRSFDAAVIDELLDAAIAELRVVASRPTPLSTPS